MERICLTITSIVVRKPLANIPVAQYGCAVFFPYQSNIFLS